MYLMQKMRRLMQQQMLDLNLESVEFFYNCINIVHIEFKNKNKTFTDFHLT